MNFELKPIALNEKEAYTALSMLLFHNLVRIKKRMKRVMFYALNDNVYIVKGSNRGCIYDFNSSNLYSINYKLTQQIDLVNKGKVLEDAVDEELEDILKKLIMKGILKLSVIPIKRQINEIISGETECEFAWIEITKKCNLKCIHCYNESDDHNDMSMSLDNYKIVIDNLLKLGIKRIQIIGGEPFWNRQSLRDMLNYTVGKFKFIEVFTNGTLITEDWFEFLAENNIYIALSVYSYQEKMHNKVTRNENAWLKTNRTIELLKSYGINYRVCNVLMKGIEVGKCNTDLYRISDERDVVRMSGRANFSLLSDSLIKKKLITKKSFCKPINKSFVARLIAGHNCFQKDIYVSSDMNVFPCVMERRIKHGMIENKGTIALDHSIRSFNKDKIKECCQCEYRYVCFDCRPDSLSGDIYEKPWYCTYKPDLGIWEDEEEFVAELKRKWGN